MERLILKNVDVSDLTPLASMPLLKELYISIRSNDHCRQLKAALTGCKQLQILHLRGPLKGISCRWLSQLEDLEDVMMDEATDCVQHSPRKGQQDFSVIIILCSFYSVS